ncbi:hypothetical protein H5410_036069 [Solanum commersonii]|uniref:Uncharacterized protein n=1 Tax=Solanum commersonii TaxID=4109 RepID=A0A9J5Y3P2_SOLCO|nr:hypothetical protein H5410_036069 [Solanum commersonii]
MKYVIKTLSTHSLRFASTYNMNFLEDFELSTEIEGIELFKWSRTTKINFIFGMSMKIYPNPTQSNLVQSYFPGVKNSVSKGRLVQCFIIGAWENNQNVVQMTIFYFIHTFIFSQLGDTPKSIYNFSWSKIAGINRFLGDNFHYPS